MFCKPPADGSTNGDPNCTQDCFNALAGVETTCGAAKCDDSMAKLECSTFPTHKSAVYDKCTVANPSVFPPGDGPSAAPAAAPTAAPTADAATAPAAAPTAAPVMKRVEMPDEVPAPAPAPSPGAGYSTYDDWNNNFAADHNVRGMDGGDDCSTDDTMSFFNDGADAVMQHSSIVMGSSDGHPTDDSSGADFTANYDPVSGQYSRLDDPNAPPQPSQECVDHANAFKATFKAGTSTCQLLSSIGSSSRATVPTRESN